MTTMTQQDLHDLWSQYAARLNNDGDPDIVRMDYYEQLSRLGGIVLRGRGGLDQQQADALLNLLKDRGCAVLTDPARDGEEHALVLFLPDQVPEDRTNVSA